MERYKITTIIWEVMVLLKDGSTYCILLKNIKDSKTVKLDEYEVGNCIQDKPEFTWSVSMVLRHRNIIILKVKSEYSKKIHKLWT